MPQSKNKLPAKPLPHLSIAVLVCLALGAPPSLVIAADSSFLEFPIGFSWCAATAAHQIEGQNTQSDWWQWESVSGHIQNADRSGNACDGWNKLQEDIGLLHNMAVKTYRFSIEWAKIEPQPGIWDEKVIAHYQQEIDRLHAVGIEPLVTLQHFTLPVWVAQKGGWEWADMPKAFAHYANYVYSRLHGVRDWITINEPMVVIYNGYHEGTFPPGQKRELVGLVPPMLGMLKAHALAYHTLHTEAEHSHKEIRVGIAHHLRYIHALHSYNPLDLLAAHFASEAWNWVFMDAVESGRFKMWVPLQFSAKEDLLGLAGTEDFIGINYYSEDTVRFSHGGFETGVPVELEKNDMGWAISPRGLAWVLEQVTDRYRKKSIFITENGIADRSDLKRTKFIHDHLVVLHEAIARGILVEGYCYWSLMDNFEWANGFWPRFGLFEVDYKTEQRVPRPSVKYFTEAAKRNGIDSALKQ